MKRDLALGASEHMMISLGWLVLIIQRSAMMVSKLVLKGNGHIAYIPSMLFHEHGWKSKFKPHPLPDKQVETLCLKCEILTYVVHKTCTLRSGNNTRGRRRMANPQCWRPAVRGRELRMGGCWDDRCWGELSLGISI